MNCENELAVTSSMARRLAGLFYVHWAGNKLKLRQIGENENFARSFSVRKQTILQTSISEQAEERAIRT